MYMKPLNHRYPRKTVSTSLRIYVMLKKTEGSKIVAIIFFDHLYARCIKKPEIMKEADPYQYRAYEILKPFLVNRKGEKLN